MSASSKKKLRNAENAEKLTEKQQAERKEAKKLKLYTAIFAVVISLMVVLAAWTAISNGITNSGVRERNTVAATIGDHEISNAEMNYFFIDAVNNFYSSYGTYASLFGLDVTKPLNEQISDEEAGTTWADDFMISALDNATAVYALVDAANEAGYTLSEEEQAEIDNSLSYTSFYASYYGYSNVDTYLKAMYGKGASEESLREYYELTTLADSYYNHYSESLTYTDEDLREAEKENYDLYSSFTYNYYYLSVNNFCEGGTTDEDGHTTYSDEEIAAGEAAALAAAEALAAGEYTSLADFDAAIAGIKDGASSTLCEDYSFDSVSAVMADWIVDDSRKAGDVGMVENTSTTENEDGEETTTLNGYYVIYFGNKNDNTFALANVRHILVAFEGGTTDDEGNTTYSDEEIAAAKTAAEELLATWEAGDANEDSFAALANEKSDDGDGTTGGLYEDIYPGQMVEAFEDWCFDSSRKAGDTGIVETEYGFHVMYYSGDSKTNYRDYQITNDLRSADTEQWYYALLDAMEVTEGDYTYISSDLVISAE